MILLQCGALEIH